MYHFIKAMKYTSQIWNGNVNIEGIVSQNMFLKPLSVMFALLVDVMGIVIFTGALLVAGILDSERYLMLQYLKHANMQRRVNYITEVVESLTNDSVIQDKTKKLLIAMLWV